MSLKENPIVSIEFYRIKEGAVSIPTEKDLRDAALRSSLRTAQSQASLITHALAVYEACIDWAHDTGECHFCSMFDATADDAKLHKQHGDDCPLAHLNPFVPMKDDG